MKPGVPDTREPKQLSKDIVEVNRKVEQNYQVCVNQNWYKPDKRNQCVFIQEYNAKWSPRKNSRKTNADEFIGGTVPISVYSTAEQSTHPGPEH